MVVPDMDYRGPPAEAGRRPAITVGPADDRPLNGLGMMMLQYLEQNLGEFDYKVRQGLGLRCRVAVQVEKGIATSIAFLGERIEIQNGIDDRADLVLKSSYITLSRILSGQAGPAGEMLRGRVRLGARPRRPFQAMRVLRFLKVPSELLADRPKNRFGRPAGLLLAAFGAALLGYLIFIMLSE
ncbi:MAG: hypothetical protein KKB20_15610 [Proteobacteria bacterium]|nr:hypothetical protein [Pseudomonadota bacterium]